MPYNPPKGGRPQPQPAKGGKGNRFQQFINKNKALKPYAQFIAEQAKARGIDAIFLAAVIMAESRGDPRADSGQAAGLTQISYGNIRAAGKTVAWVKLHPKWAITWAAQKLGAAYELHKDYHKAYILGYNPSDPNREKAWGKIAAAQTGGYVFGVGGSPPTPQSPKTIAEHGIAVSNARESITHSDFMSRWNEYNVQYEAYAGRKATNREARFLIKNGVSIITLTRNLAKQKAFYKSPMWEAKADEYFGTAKDMGINVDRKLVARAIVNSWSGTKFQEHLRKQPGYLQSNEFLTQEAGFTNNYRTLYGNPTPEITNQIKQAVLGRWTEAQWTSYLRSLPQYRESSEYQSEAQKLQAMLGFLPTDEERPPVAGAAPKPPKTPKHPRY